MIVRVAAAVSHCCSVRTGSDCDTVLQVLCVPPGVAALDAAARGRGGVCNAALPLCITSVVTRCVCVAALLCCCVAVCGTALHWTVGAAVSGSSRAAAVEMCRSLRRGYGAVTVS